MKQNSRIFKIKKTKNYIKNNNFFFFSNGVNKTAAEWLLIEQDLKNLNFKYYKIYNKTTVKSLKNSIFTNIKSTINGITFFLQPKLNIKFKDILLNKFNPLLFVLLTLKINNKTYTINQLKNANSLNILDTQFIFYKFGVTNLKLLIKR